MASQPEPSDETANPCDPLAVVDAVAEALARFDGEDSTTGHAEALRLLAEGFGATMATVARFTGDGARVIGLWAGGRFRHDPGIELDRDLFSESEAFRANRRPVVVRPEGLGRRTAAMLDALGPGQALVVAPISDADEVTGAVAMLVPSPDGHPAQSLVAIQLCGELLWRHIRHHESRRELHERVEIAEILARTGGRLQEGGVANARSLLEEVFSEVGEYVGADFIGTYERSTDHADLLVAWTSSDAEPGVPRLVLDSDEWDRFAQGPRTWTRSDPDDVGSQIRGGRGAGVVVPGTVDGRVVGLFSVGRHDERSFPDAHVELVVGTVALLSQFRGRMGAELAAVRRGVVELCRTETAEAFINSPAGMIDDVVAAALRRIGEVFGARRVRWVDFPGGSPTGRLAVEWSDGSRPAAPETFAAVVPPAARGSDVRDPFVLDPAQVSQMCGVDTPSPTLVVPAVVGNDVTAVLTLTGDGLDAELPLAERRALTDLAGLVQQARVRAAQELQADYRRTLDDLQVRLAQRFLDRTVDDAGPVLNWVLGEIGAAVDCDLLAFAEFGGTTDGEAHWWCRDDEAIRAAAAMDHHGASFKSVFAACFDSGEPMVIRSADLPDRLRRPTEERVGGAFSLLLVPFRAPGVALLLGACSFEDRAWQDLEIALFRQVIGQLRQFIDVVAGRGRLEFDASHDALTGLANRRKLAEEFAAHLESGRRGAVLMIDVDRFKVVNDSLGHSAGDSVLVAIADRLRMSVRLGDLVGRFGGDEFALMVRDATSDLELAATADRLIQVIREPILVRGTTVIPTCSIGIATAGRGDDVEAVLRHADAALYDAKAKGRDRYEFFDDAYRLALTERLHLETALRTGVAAGEFVPWYQPEYDLETLEIVGVEALVRWDHPEQGIIDASGFVDTAEELGLAPELSRLVMRRSMETLRDWIDDGFDTRVRVNVAAAQLQSRELAEQIEEILADTAVPADRLCIEITERSLMLDPDSAIDALTAVRDLGVEVAVDDFGTGFSSLARLKHLPVDTLKIDRSFVSGIVTSATDREIVRTIIWLSRGLGLGVVAEGVEHADQAELLLDLGCHRAQGWLWSPALPAAEVPRLVRV